MSSARERKKKNQQENTTTVVDKEDEEGSEVVVGGKGSVEREDDSFRLTGEDLSLMLLFLVCGVWTRLKGLDFPNGVCFDEYHNGRFISFYIRGIFFIDVHPPLVKLIFAYVARTFGYTGHFSFDNIGHIYESDWYYYVRLVPAISNIIHLLLIYITCRVLKLRTLAAFIVTTMFLLDNSQTVQSRFMLLDGVLLLFMQMGLLFSIIASRYSRIFSAKYHFYLFISGLFLALAMSTKLTALSYVGTVILYQSFHFIRHLFTNSSTSTRIVSLFYRFLFAIIICIVIPIIVVFMICVAIHFYLLPYYVVPYPEGGPIPDNFDKYSKAMGNEYFSTLLPEGSPLSQVKHFSVRDYLYYLNVYIYHTYLFSTPSTTVHSSQTMWYEWVLATARPIIYWQSGANPKSSWIVNSLSPGFNLVALFLILCFFALPFLQMWWVSLKSTSAMGDRLVKSIRKYFSVEGTAFFIGWAATLLPFGFLLGPSFLYHYYPGACLALLLGAIMLEIVFYTLKDSYWRFVVYVFVALALLNLLSMFYFLSPWIYATPLPNTSHDRRLLLNKWPQTSKPSQ